MIRRLFDFIAALISLILLAPFVLVISILIKRDSEGPAIFKQERVGHNGRTFTLLKFRSMSVAAAPDGPLVTAGTDARITKVGAKLRSTKLDELPQLINVLRGDMSLVGPRPEVRKYVDLWDPQDSQIILSVRPGITDPITLQLRREEELLAQQDDAEAYYREVLLPQKAKAYARYVKSRTMSRDVKVVFSTLRGVACG